MLRPRSAAKLIDHGIAVDGEQEGGMSM